MVIALFDLPCHLNTIANELQIELPAQRTLVLDNYSYVNHRLGFHGASIGFKCIPKAKHHNAL